MDFHQNNSKLEDGSLNLEEGKERQLEKQRLAASSSPPSASSSPSHEFSFSVSLQTSSTDETKAPPSFTIDLSPADDIFFHGHLLPLHLLSHLPVPPRCSTNSIESYALPIRDLLSEKEPKKESSNFINCKSNEHYQNSNSDDTREKPRSKSFSNLLGLRWRKGFEVEEQETKVKQLKRKLGFNLSHVLKRYARMVRPFLHFKGRRDDMQLRRQSYSFSGNLSSRNKQELRGRRGQFSAPVSMRTSPTNSGILLTKPLPPSTNNDSTMEELQAAIQAAIAHCKNSILKEERLKC
ncbi:BRI1 kinase inhibitor 1-like [Momordica charantia]|uniref:BRI1 kinase inhibitor 1-like n=1 Tax=Momordica charantia TaxID=3673 RepID=A0A6J1CRJ3_MOMCH|nr:BRI1 kinase inhibitor 1-like [Momordica charantia]